MADPLYRKEVIVFTPEHWYGLNVPLKTFDEYYIVLLSDDYVILAVMGWDKLSVLVKANVDFERRKESK